MNHLTNPRRWNPADWLFALGYICLVACYTPQWILIWRTGSAAGMDPSFLALATFGLVMLQAGLFLRRGRDTLPLLVGNAAALVNALVLDTAWLWATVWA